MYYQVKVPQHHGRYQYPHLQVKKILESRKMFQEKTFYRHQNSLIDEFEKIAEDKYGLDEEASKQKQLSEQKKISICAKVTLIANVLLLIGKLVSTIVSGSLSIFSSLVDSAVDLLSGIIMWASNRAMKKTNHYVYPSGRTKLEPIAIVVLSTVMSLASVFVMVESVQKIIEYAQSDAQVPPSRINATNSTENICNCQSKPSRPNVEASSITILSATIVTKFILWIAMRKITIPSVQALSQDHRNDTLSNAVALVMAFIGSEWWSYADPLGAILIAIYIIFSWWQMGYAQIKMLTGYTASPDFLKKLTWAALNHDKNIQQLDTVRAFHFGNNYLVEVDIVLPADMTVQEAHEIQEPLQRKLEKMPEVERAFVHVDYEYTHRPTMEHKVI